MLLLNAICIICVFYVTQLFPGSGTPLLDEDNAILKYGHQFADYLGRGLADNWSQVQIKICLQKFFGQVF